MCFGVVFAAWVIGSLTGLDEASIIGFPLDPVAWWGSGLGLAAVISLGHKIRPEGSIELVLMGWLEPGKYICRKSEGDKNWYPNLMRPHFRQSAVNKISLGRLKKKKTFRALPDANAADKKRSATMKKAKKPTNLDDE